MTKQKRPYSHPWHTPGVGRRAAVVALAAVLLMSACRADNSRQVRLLLLEQALVGALKVDGKQLPVLPCQMLRFLGVDSLAVADSLPLLKQALTGHTSRCPALDPALTPEQYIGKYSLAELVDIRVGTLSSKVVFSVVRGTASQTETYVLRRTGTGFDDWRFARRAVSRRAVY